MLQRFELLPFDCCIDNNMMAMFQITENIPWLRYALTLLNFKQFVNPGAVPSISQSQIGALKIPCPPKPEQLEINDYIEKKVGFINRLSSHFENEIARMQEYKSSLISAVVTGQVDIRNIPVDDFDPADLVSEVPDDPEGENATEESEE